MSKHRKRKASFITEDGEEESPSIKYRRRDNCGGQGNEGRGNSSSHSRVPSKGKSRMYNKCCNKHKFSSPSGSSSNVSATSCDHEMPEARNNSIISTGLPPAAVYSQDEIGESLEPHQLLIKEDDICFNPGQELDVPIQSLTVEVQSEDIVTNPALHGNTNTQSTTMDLEMPLIAADILESPNGDVPIQLITTEVLTEQDPGIQEEISQASDTDPEGNDIFTELWLSPDVPIAISTVEVITEEDQADRGHMVTTDPEETVSEAPVLPASEGDVPIQPVTVEVLTESLGMNGINQYFQVQDENAVIINRSSLEEVPHASTHRDETYHDMLASGFTSSPPAQNISADTCLEQRDRSRSDDGRRRGRSLRRSGRSLRRRRRTSTRNLRPSLSDSDMEEEEREREDTGRDSGLEGWASGSSGMEERREEVNTELVGREMEINSDLTRTNEEEDAEVHAVLSAIIELAREEGIPLQEFFEVVVQEEIEDSDGFTQAELDKLPVRKFGELDSESPSSYKCSICLTEFEHGDAIRTLTSCVHEFHQSCIDEWLKTTNTCPLCRTVVTPH